MFAAARNVGGLYINKSHRGDKDAKPPIEVVPAETQRAALALLEQEVFGPEAYNFPPELYSHLAASHWLHWGTTLVDRADYPAHRVISMWQDRILSKLLSSLTLSRMYDSELKVPHRRGRADHRRADPPAHQGRLLGNRDRRGRRVHRPSAGHLQRPPQPAAVVPCGSYRGWPSAIRPPRKTVSRSPTPSSPA